ncbi:MAG: hypothetical protein E4G98_01765 [Promethearchaeota archaeon]|nr:MAG: hypothetical protein E4G98_01765 [Candidatus Lokiarchaeota archaeon]
MPITKRNPPNLHFFSFFFMFSFLFFLSFFLSFLILFFGITVINLKLARRKPIPRPIMRIA